MELNPGDVAAINEMEYCVEAIFLKYIGLIRVDLKQEKNYT